MGGERHLSVSPKNLSHNVSGQDFNLDCPIQSQAQQPWDHCTFYTPIRDQNWDTFDYCLF